MTEIEHKEGDSGVGGQVLFLDPNGITLVTIQLATDLILVIFCTCAFTLVRGDKEYIK